MIMFKNKFTNFFKKPIFIAAFASVVFSFSLYTYFESVNIEKAQVDVKDYISMWQYQLGEDLHYGNNEKLILTIAEQLKTKPISEYEILKNDQILYSWKKEGVNSSCEHPTESLLTLKGIHIGKIKTCINKAQITEATLFSKELMIVYLFTTVLLFLVGFMPLRGYKKSLFKLADTLEGWSGDPSEGFNFYTNDKGTDRILEMIQEGTQSRIDLKEIQSDLESEKSISKATRRMAHDIRSPMEALEGLKHELKESTPPLVQGIYKASMKRIRNIIDEAHAEHNGYAQEEAKSSDIKPVIDLVLKEKKRSLKDIKIDSNVDYNIQALFVPKKLSRVLSNVINNAAESYDGSSGTVWISLVQDDKFTTLEVKDQGKGISEKHLPMIFQENFSYGKKKGQGIGLSTAKHWLEGWGGFIHIDSKSGIGTTAKIVLKNKLEEQPQKMSEAVI